MFAPRISSARLGLFGWNPGQSGMSCPKWIKRQSKDLATFHWQDGYGLFGVSPSHFELVRRYILGQEEHHRRVSFQEEFLRILKKYRVDYDERHLWD